MDKDSQSSPGPADSGLGPSRGRIGIAVALAVACVGLLALLWMPGAAEPEPVLAMAAPAAAPAPTPVQVAAQASPPNGAPRPSAPAPEGDADPTPDLSSYVARGEQPSMAQVIERLHQRGIHSGLGAFNPPGTSPPLIGLAVPEDFSLPKGYVRHHQATDDGQRIEAILMFSPDFQPVDASGNPIKLPDNRVVPPELAPPGLPIRRIVVPPSTLNGDGR